MAKSMKTLALHYPMILFLTISFMLLEFLFQCNDSVKLCTDHFKQSVKMSTYLVAFIVCDFKNITNTTQKGVEVKFKVYSAFVCR